ncbi:MAG: hypothetical protein KJT03_16700, partial [Verrucomicrobiae bacterium]|nr:hypothetical protein [Verrucomicrobiae bacterium]
MSNRVSMFRPLREVRLSAEPEEEVVPSEAELVNEALEEARKEGYKRGKLDAETALSESMKMLKHLECKTIASLVEQEQNLVSEVEQALPELVLECVRRIIETWEPEAEEIEKLVRDLLSGLERDSGRVRVYLNSADKEKLLSLHEDVKKDFPDISFLEDDQLVSGECYVRGRFGTTDGRFAARLE